MMDDKEKMVPRFRFQRFEDAWEQRKLGDVVQVTMGQSPDSRNYTDDPNDFILVQGNADMKNGLVVPRVWTKQVTKKADKGDLILSVRAPVGEVGKTEFDVVLGRGVAGIKGNEFIYQNLLNFKISGYWLKFSTGSTFMSISSDDIRNASISLPDLEEQNMIGEFLTAFDNLIVANEKKVQQLKGLKKLLMQKVFAQIWRFKGFTDPWEQRKLGTIVSLYTKKSTIQDEYPMLTSSQKGLRFQNEYFDNKNTRAKKNIGYSIIPFGYATYRSRSDNGIFHFNVNKLVAKGIISYFYPVFYSKNESIEFVVLNLNQTKKREVSILSVGTGQHVLSIRQLLNLNILMPSLDEQLSINETIKVVDDLIVANEKKLSQLKRMKKYLMQNMFV